MVAVCSVQGQQMHSTDSSLAALRGLDLEIEMRQGSITFIHAEQGVLDVYQMRRRTMIPLRIIFSTSCLKVGGTSLSIYLSRD